MYKPLWSQLYNTCKLDALKYDASVQLIEMGETFTICACDNGKLFSWGCNDFFQLGRNTNEIEEIDKTSIGVIKLMDPPPFSEAPQVQKVSFDYFSYFHNKLY